MKTWHDCPGKDSEQYPGKPGHVVSPEAPAACNQCCQHDHLHTDTDDHDALNADYGIYIHGAILILILLLVQYMYVGTKEITHQGRYQDETFGARHAWFGQARAQL